MPYSPCKIAGLPFPAAASSKSALQLLLEILFFVAVSSMYHYLSVVLLLVAISLLPHYLPRVPLFVVVLPRLTAYFLLEVPFLVAHFSTIHFPPVVELF